MRLLEVKIESDTLLLRHKTFLSPDDIPRYVVLSHTWLADEEEIQFEHVQSERQTSGLAEKFKKGYQKIRGCCEKAIESSYDYVWIDTCCIDKSSSAELSEAINSMFQIYQKAAMCFVHLADVHAVNGSIPQSLFRQSRWFKRGWTLQELLAPWRVEFFTSDWTHISDKHILASFIQEATGIEQEVLRGMRPLDTVPIATKMSYAAKRLTKRPEDRAYSLMGLFGVHMPTIYGEGGDSAFIRLQHEIMALSPAHGLLAWRDPRIPDSSQAPPSPVLAQSPSYFASSHNIIDIPYHDFAAAWNLNNKAVGFQQGPNCIRADLPVFDVPRSPGKEIDAIMVIPCKYIDLVSGRVHTLGLALKRSDNQGDQYFRTWNSIFVNVDCLGNMGIRYSHRSITLFDRAPKPSLSTLPYTRPERLRWIVVRCCSEDISLSDFGPRSALHRLSTLNRPIVTGRKNQVRTNCYLLFLKASD